MGPLKGKGGQIFPKIDRCCGLCLGWTSHRVGGAGGGRPPSGGPLPWGVRFLWRKRRKEHQGLRPLDPGGEGRRFLPSRSPSLGCGNGKGKCSVGVTGLRPSQLEAPKASRPPIGRLAPIVRTLRKQTWAYLFFRYFSSCHFDFFRFPHREKNPVPQPPKWWAARLGAFRCVGRRPVNRKEEPPSIPEKTREGGLGGGTSSPERGSRGQRPMVLFPPAFSRESRAPRGQRPPGKAGPSSPPVRQVDSPGQTPKKGPRMGALVQLLNFRLSATAISSQRLL